MPSPRLAHLFCLPGQKQDPASHADTEFAPRPRRTARIGGLALSAALGLSACALDKETHVRAALQEFLKLGETYYFYTTTQCTAALFDVKASRISSFAKKVRSVDAGLAALGEEDDIQPISFEIPGLSPTAVTEEVMTRDLPKGLGVLTAGVAGKDCMAKEMEVAYFNALLDPTSVMIFDPEDKFTVIFDRRNSRAFYSRGRT